MKRLLSLAALGAGLVGAAGCCSGNCASTGWEFRVGKPATFYSPGLVQQNNGPLSVAPLGTTMPPQISDVGAQLVNPPRLEAPRHLMRMAPPAPPDTCTCEQLLQALNRIEQRLATLPQAPGMRPLPKGEGTE